MKKVESAGIIIYTISNKQRLYLLLHYTAGHWDLPKGKVEPGEQYQETALRELEEETNLKDPIIDKDFFESLSYDFVTHEHTKAHKTVFFFIGYVDKDSPIKLSDEHINYQWCSFEKAIEQLTYNNAQKIVTKAEQFLRKKE